MDPTPHISCTIPHRLLDLRAQRGNGIDSVEVSDDGLVLTVSFFTVAPDLRKEMVVISGGARVRDIAVTELVLHSDEDDEDTDSVRIMLNKAGDLSTYTLRLVELDASGRPTGRPLGELDPRYGKAEFTFHAGRATELDCSSAEIGAEAPEVPAISNNYLAKDFASFRSLILDRLALTLPDWTERHLPDGGIALIEVLAYVADYLSYYQDAVATEAYLSTARQRISVRRHVKLLDYSMHEGCNARTWISLTASEDQVAPGLNPSTLNFFASSVLPDDRTFHGSVLSDVTDNDIFQPISPAPILIRSAHEAIPFHTWGDLVCTLPKGATGATLRDTWKPEPPVAGDDGTYNGNEARGDRRSHASEAAAAQLRREEYRQFPPKTRERELHLQPGDLLLLQEILGPVSGSADDADPSHRQIVRLTSVELGLDPLYDQPIVEVTWDAEDALLFPLVISCLGSPPGCAISPDVSLASANIVLADSGSWVTDEPLGIVPAKRVDHPCNGAGEPGDLGVVADRFRPTLLKGPLVFREPYVPDASAARSLTQDPRRAAPIITLRSIAPLPDGSGPVLAPAELANLSLLVDRLRNATDDATAFLRDGMSARTLSLLHHGGGEDAAEKLRERLGAEIERFITTWTVRPDLLNSFAIDKHFAVEIDDSGFAHLRFGDGTSGRAPDAGSSFLATYRVDGGTRGDIGAGSVDGVSGSSAAISGLRITAANPLPVGGRIAPEEIASVKLLAPGAYRRDIERAITAADYAALAERHPGVQRAAAALLWTGNGYQVQVAIDPLGIEIASPALLDSIHASLRRYRRIGHRIIVVGAHYVPLDLALTVEVEPGYLRAQVKSALLRIFSSRGDGLFNPDALTFGTSIFSSQIIAAAQGVEGVVSVTITNLARLQADPAEQMQGGVLTMDALEIPRLDGDPTHPENGRLRITIGGGR